jgi:Fur family ferric uptake transcriptional regulator
MKRLNDFEKYLSQKGLKITREREKIVQLFLKSDKHLNVEELYHKVKKIDPQIGYSTVYRTLRLLVKANLAAERHFGDRETRFEPIRKNEHHDHLICIKCGRIIEFENKKIEELQEEVAKRNDFEVVRHRLELYGYCSRCKR